MTCAKRRFGGLMCYSKLWSWWPVSIYSVKRRLNANFITVYNFLHINRPLGTDGYKSYQKSGNKY